MNAKITRPIIDDLLPIYLAGDASPDTQALVESYLREDPEMTENVRKQGCSLKLHIETMHQRLHQDPELQALRLTRRRLRHRTWHLILALMLTLFTITYHIGPDGIRWTWAANPLVTVILGLLAGLAWGVYLHVHRSLRGTGI